jgi:hypothetical protein
MFGSIAYNNGNVALPDAKKLRNSYENAHFCRSIAL